jgi:hypothetical protein
MATQEQVNSAKQTIYRARLNGITVAPKAAEQVNPGDVESYTVTFDTRGEAPNIRKLLKQQTGKTFNQSTDIVIDIPARQQVELLALGGSSVNILRFPKKG